MKIKGEKKIYYVNDNHKRTRVGELLSDKMDFKTNVTKLKKKKKKKKDKYGQRQRPVFYNDKRARSSGRYNNNKHTDLSTELQKYTKQTQTEARNRQLNRNSWETSALPNNVQNKTKSASTQKT